jgi:uncharacterized membrane protein
MSERMSERTSGPSSERSSTHGALPWATRGLVGAFLVSGVVHLVRPQLFEPIVPEPLPAKRALVQASGVAELVCAAGLLRRSRWAPAASAALLLAVWPANGQDAVQVQRSARTSSTLKALVWARFPLQVPMIRAALRSPIRGAARS